LVLLRSTRVSTCFAWRGDIWNLQMSSRISEYHNDHACQANNRSDYITLQNIRLCHHDVTHAHTRYAGPLF
jgi:hypothetical protein